MKFIKINLNKIFPFLPLKFKLIIAFALLSSVPLFIVGIIGIYNNIDKMREIALENLSHDVSISNERAQNFISNVSTDINYLIRDKSLSSLLSSNTKNTDWSDYSSFILNFAKTHNIYFQFRFADLKGDEKFRIQKIGNVYREYGSDSLIQGGFEFYFNLTKYSRRNSINMIPAELIGPGNTRVPAISFAVRVWNDQNHFEGIFIADVFAQKFFRVIEQKTQLRSGKEIAIVNSEGRYLYHSSRKKNWNKLLAEQSSDNIFNKYSSRFTKDIVSGKSGILKINSDEIVAYSPLFISTFTGGNSYFIYETVDQKYIIGPAKRFAIISVGFILLFLIISITFGTFATNQIAKPIQELRKGAEIISEGNYSHQLAIHTNDEIEQLAFQFNKMAMALNDREKLLKRNKEELERIVVERTRELKNEKEKLQAVLDNVPSAFILMDDECRIISASSAIKSLANLNPDELPGKKCSDIFMDKSFCENCELNRSQNNHKQNYFIESRLITNGEEKFIEHTTIPILIDHNKNAVLEILTDVTERKKLDEHLLKLQKLITIGETSALIAHQIRNSLTSVKMLLQLQRENSVVKEEVNSLDFSLSSIQRMERVIDNLLKLGQQVDYKLTNVNIKDLVDECFLILKPRFEKSNLKFIREIAADIPVLFIDAVQFQEAITNLMINSIQATGKGGEIKITCKVKTLRYNLTDFGYIDQKLNKTNHSEYKIRLLKGEKIVAVEISDNGKGISKKNISKIFDPFFTTKEDGSGLGLAMVKKTINNHGGIVQVKSEECKGTLIKLLIPVRENI